MGVLCCLLVGFLRLFVAVAAFNSVMPPPSPPAAAAVASPLPDPATHASACAVLRCVLCFFLYLLLFSPAVVAVGTHARAGGRGVCVEQCLPTYLATSAPKLISADDRSLSDEAARSSAEAAVGPDIPQAGPASLANAAGIYACMISYTYVINA